MRTTWEESTYYDRLNDLLNIRMAGLPTKDYHNALIRLADEELADDMWLRSHYNTTAEYLYECVDIEAAESCGATIVELIEFALREIRLFRKYHMNADAQMDMLIDALYHLNYGEE